MKTELLAFTRLSDLLSPLPPYDWPLFWPQVGIGLLLIVGGWLYRNIRLWAVVAGSLLLLITAARYLSVLYLGSRLILLLWLISSIIGLVWIVRQPKVATDVFRVDDQSDGLSIPPKRRRR